MARQPASAYRLKITLNETSQGIALQNDATITRYNNTLDARYTLSDAQRQCADHRQPDRIVGL